MGVLSPYLIVPGREVGDTIRLRERGNAAAAAVTCRRSQSVPVLSPCLIEPGREAGGAIRLREPVYAAAAVTWTFQ